MVLLWGGQRVGKKAGTKENLRLDWRVVEWAALMASMTAA